MNPRTATRRSVALRRKRIVALVLALAVVSQGTARATEPATASEVRTEPNQAALLAHLDGMTPGDRVAVAVADGIVAGEFVDKDADDVVIDRPLLEGGVERITIPLKEIQGVRYQATTSSRVETIEKAAIVVALVGVAIWLGRALLLPRP